MNVEYIEARIAILDFVLANPDLSYLETEPDKLAFFCRELNIDAHALLPSKTYLGRHTVQPTVRYFVDRFPMFLSQSNFTVAHRDVFLHSRTAKPISPRSSTISKPIRPLFRELREFRFLYLARTDAHFAKARELFNALVTVPLESQSRRRFAALFRHPQGWDLHQYGSVTEADLVFRNVSKERFAESASNISIGHGKPIASASPHPRSLSGPPPSAFNAF